MKLKILFRCALASIALILASCVDLFTAIFVATFTMSPQILPYPADYDQDGVIDQIDDDPSDPNIPYQTTSMSVPAPLVAFSPQARVTQNGPRALGAASEIGVESFGFPVVISLPLTFQTTDAKGATVLKKRTLKNKELINLLKGRDLKTPVSKNERLIALLPTDYTHPEDTNIFLFESGQQPTFDILLKGDTSSLIFGGPAGNWTASYSDGRLPSLSSPGFSIIGINRLSLSALGGEKTTKKGPIQKSKAATISGRIVITDAEGTKTALVIGGTVIVAGKPLVVIRK